MRRRGLAYLEMRYLNENWDPAKQGLCSHLLYRQRLTRDLVCLERDKNVVVESLTFVSLVTSDAAAKRRGLFMRTRIGKGG